MWPWMCTYNVTSQVSKKKTPRLFLPCLTNLSGETILLRGKIKIAFIYFCYVSVCLFVLMKDNHITYAGNRLSLVWIGRSVLLLFLFFVLE